MSKESLELEEANAKIASMLEVANARRSRKKAVAANGIASSALSATSTNSNSNSNSNHQRKKTIVGISGGGGNNGGTTGNRKGGRSSPHGKIGLATTATVVLSSSSPSGRDTVATSPKPTASLTPLSARGGTPSSGVISDTATAGAVPNSGVTLDLRRRTGNASGAAPEAATVAEDADVDGACWGTDVQGTAGAIKESGSGPEKSLLPSVISDVITAEASAKPNDATDITAAAAKSDDHNHDHDTSNDVTRDLTNGCGDGNNGDGVGRGSKAAATIVDANRDEGGGEGSAGGAAESPEAGTRSAKGRGGDEDSSRKRRREDARRSINNNFIDSTGSSGVRGGLDERASLGTTAATRETPVAELVPSSTGHVTGENSSDTEEEKQGRMLQNSPKKSGLEDGVGDFKEEGTIGDHERGTLMLSEVR